MLANLPCTKIACEESRSSVTVTLTTYHRRVHASSGGMDCVLTVQVCERFRLQHGLLSIFESGCEVWPRREASVWGIRMVLRTEHSAGEAYTVVTSQSQSSAPLVTGHPRPLTLEPLTNKIAHATGRVVFAPLLGIVLADAGTKKIIATHRDKCG